MSSRPFACWILDLVRHPPPRSKSGNHPGEWAPRKAALRARLRSFHRNRCCKGPECHCDGRRGGEVHFVGEVDASLDAMRRTLQRITAKYGVVHCCYEAGPTGYGLYRLIVELGHSAWRQRHR